MSTIRTPACFFSSVTRIRRLEGAYISGVWTDGASYETTITASVQPTGPRELMRLPEGLRTRDSVKIFTADSLRSANESSGLAADRIVYQGEEYEVVSAGGYTHAQMPHVEAVAVRVDRAGVDPAGSPA